jgi:hypothetical protein
MPVETLDAHCPTSNTSKKNKIEAASTKFSLSKIGFNIKKNIVLSAYILGIFTKKSVPVSAYLYLKKLHGDCCSSVM